MKPEEFEMMAAPAYTYFLQYKGAWDMQDLYESMADFFRQQKFKFYEIVYKHKHPSPFGAERQYVWRGERNVEEYYKYVLDIFMHTYEASDIEVTMKDGSKRIFTKGRIRIQFRGRVAVDYEKKWEENAFYAQLYAQGKQPEENTTRKKRERPAPGVGLETVPQFAGLEEGVVTRPKRERVKPSLKR